MLRPARRVQPKLCRPQGAAVHVILCVDNISCFMHTQCQVTSYYSELIYISIPLSKKIDNNRTKIYPISGTEQMTWNCTHYALIEIATFCYVTVKHRHTNIQKSDSYHIRCVIPAITIYYNSLPLTTLQGLISVCELKY